MTAPVWRHLPLRAILLLLWPALQRHWKLVLGGTAGGIWQLKNVVPNFPFWAVPLLAIALIFGITVYRFISLRFCIDAQGVQLKRGLWEREEVIMPFSRVQGMQLHQPLWLRVLGLHEVVLESSGSEHDALLLPAVSDEIVEELRLHMRREGAAMPSGANRSPQGTATAGLDNEDAPASADGSTGAGSHATDGGIALHSLNRRELLLLSLTSVQTLMIGPLVLGTLSRMGEGENKKWFWTHVKLWVQHYFATTDEGVMAAIIIVGGVLGTLLLALAWGAWRYAGFHLQQNGNEWHQRSGLITPFAQTLHPARAIGVAWTQNFLQHRFGLGWLQIKTMGGTNDGHHPESHSRAFRVPWLSYVKALQLQQRLYAQQPGVLAKAARYQAVSPLYLKRNRFKFIILPACLTLLAAWMWLGMKPALLYFLTPCLLWLALGEWRLRGGYRRWRFAISADSLRVQSGFWQCTRMLLPWSAVQSVHLKQSPFDRRWQLANVVLNLPFGRVVLPCLPLADARKLFDYAAAQAILPPAQQQP